MRGREVSTWIFVQGSPEFLVTPLMQRFRTQESGCPACKLETDRNSISVTVFRPKLDHVETETSRNWISSVGCSDLQSDDVIFQKQWAGLTAWSESSQVHSASPRTGEQEIFSLVCNLYYCHFTIRYDTVRDAILTCARKPT